MTPSKRTTFVALWIVLFAGSAAIIALTPIWAGLWSILMIPVLMTLWAGTWLAALVIVDVFYGE